MLKVIVVKIWSECQHFHYKLHDSTHSLLVSQLHLIFAFVHLFHDFKFEPKSLEAIFIEMLVKPVLQKY